MICDSTNIFSPGRAGSESDVRDSLLRIMEIKTNRILVTSFASNVARMESIFYCAKKTGRNICLVGRSMQRIYRAAKKCGYLQGLIEPLDPKDAKKVIKNIDKVLEEYFKKNKIEKTSEFKNKENIYPVPEDTDPPIIDYKFKDGALYFDFNKGVFKNNQYKENENFTKQYYMSWGFFEDILLY